MVLDFIILSKETSYIKSLYTLILNMYSTIVFPEIFVIEVNVDKTISKHIDTDGVFPYSVELCHLKFHAIPLTSKYLKI